MTALISHHLVLRAARSVPGCASTLQHVLQHYLRQPKSTSVDAIDCFTNDLVERKKNKWKTLRDRLDIGPEMLPAPKSAPLPALTIRTASPAVAATVVPLTLRATAKRILQELHGQSDDAVRMCVNVQTLSAPHIDQLLLSALLDHDEHDFYALLDECVRWRKLPTDSVIVDCLLYVSASAVRSLYTDQILGLIAEQNAVLYAAHAGFTHFQARCRWYCGEHAEALAAWTASYAVMRERRLVEMADALRGCLREAVELTVNSAGGVGPELNDAVVDAVEATAQELSRVFGENQMLMYLWKCSFVSDQFRHQQRAVRMFDECEEIRAFVGQKTSWLCFNMLQEHNVDGVHRLIELLLKFGMKNDCRTCLSFLFDYQYWRRDLRACSEIMRSSLDIDAPLSDAHNQRLLTLLLGPSNAATVPKKPATRSAQTKFELQF